MLIYRICRTEFATALNASGLAGRWNQNGQKVLYASATRSLAALEQLANRSGLILNASFSVMIIEVPDSMDALRTVNPEMLSSDWRRFSGYGRLQEVGADWYRRLESLLLRVPSVLIPKEYNYLIHTLHPDFDKKVRIVGVEAFDWDNRLIL
jgi:RES domain-containing protein